MFFFIIATVFLVIGVYCVLAFSLKIPKFKTAFTIMSKQTKGVSSKNNKAKLFSAISKPLSQFIPLSMSKEISLRRMLQNTSVETPKEYVARLTVTFFIISLFGLPLLLIYPYLALIPIAISGLTVFVIHDDVKDKATKQNKAAQKEIPGFIDTFTHAVKTNRNILNIFDSYIQNYDTALSKELSFTLADMRTGGEEIGLKRFEMRMNNALVSQLVRGILATLHGEDMSLYFIDLVKTVNEIRRKELTQKALKIKPKISLMSNGLAMFSIGVLIVILGFSAFEYIKTTM